MTHRRLLPSLAIIGALGIASQSAAQDAHVLDQLPDSAVLSVALDVSDLLPRWAEEVDQTTTEVWSSWSPLLASALGADESLLATLNPDSLGTIGVGFSDEEQVIVLSSAALSVADGTVERFGDTTEITTRGDWTAIGTGALFDAFQEAGGSGSNQQTWGAAGPLLSGALFTAVVSDFQASLGEDEDLEAIGLDEIESLLLTVDSEWRPSLALRNSGDSLSRMLGGTQAGAGLLIDELGELDAGSLITPEYAELVTRSVLSFVEYSSEDGVEVATLRDPPCGSSLRLLPWLIGFSAMYFEEGSSLDGSPAFTPIAQPISENCGPLAGPAPALPVELSRLAPIREDETNVLFGADIAALLRSFAPSAGGLLPFSMDGEELAAAMGESPLGLENGLAEAEGTLMFFMSEESGDRLLLGYPGVSSWAGGDFEELSSNDVELRDGTHAGHWALASESMWEVLEAGGSNDAWSTLIASQPEGIAGVLGLAGPTGGATDSVPDGAIQDLADSAQAAVIGFSLNPPRISVTLLVDSAEQRAVSVNAELNDLAQLAAFQLQSQVGNAVPLDEQSPIQLTAVADNVLLVEAPEVSWINRVVVAGIVVAVAAPAFIRYIKRSHTSEATSNVQMLSDSSEAYFGERGEFPESIAMTPGLPGFFAMCEESDEFAPNRAQWQSETWSQLNFEINDPHRYAYQYDSSGAGDSAQFTASAFGDLDCDGVYSTFVRFGRVVDGAVVPSAGVYISNQLE